MNRPQESKEVTEVQKEKQLTEGDPRIKQLLFPSST